MTSPTINLICVDHLEILDWYDGPVLAIATAEVGAFLVVLVAVQHSSDRRIYALVRIDDSYANSLLKHRHREDDSDLEFGHKLRAVMTRLPDGAFLTRLTVRQALTLSVCFDSEFSISSFVPYQRDSCWSDEVYVRWNDRMSQLEARPK